MTAVAPEIVFPTTNTLEDAGAHCVLVDTAAPIPFDIIASKIRVPTARPDSVSRTALVNRLRARTATRFVSIVAPAGYGKTTLFSQWAARDDRPFLWISADERDDDAVVLLRHLAAAVDRVSPIDGSVFDALRFPVTSIWTSAVPRLAAALESLSGPVVLVVDDAHLLRDVDAANALYSVAEHLPLGSVLAVAARVQPMLPIASLRAEGRLLEIGAEALALTRRETELLVRSAGLELSADELDELASRTEGWPAAVALVVYSLTDAALQSRAGDAPPTQDALFAEYLEAEHFAGMGADDLDFLRSSAALDRVCGSLCDAALATSGSGQRLSAAGRSNRFLIAVDGEPGWYRFHHLVRDLLRRDLDEREPEAASTLHGRAADWFEARGDHESALEHANDAGDVDRTARLTAQLALPVYDNGRIATVEGWLARFDDDTLLARYPAVAAHGARLHALGGRAAEAERWLAAAEIGTASDDSSNADVRPWIAALRAAFCRDGVGQMLSDAEAALAELPERSDWRPGALVVRGAARALTGDHERADRDFADAATSAERLGSTEMRILALGERSLLATARGDTNGSAAIGLSADDGQEANSALGFPTAATHFAATARAELRCGNWDAARTQLAKAQQLTPFLTEALPWLAVQARVELARAYVTLRDVTAANALLLEIDSILRERPDLGSLVDDVHDLRSDIAAIPRLEPGRASGLTGAELRLLPLLATHLSFREIGTRLYVSRNTIKTQAISVYRKLGVSTRSEAVDRAAELGLVEVASLHAS